MSIETTGEKEGLPMKTANREPETAAANQQESTQQRPTGTFPRKQINYPDRNQSRSRKTQCSTDCKKAHRFQKPCHQADECYNRNRATKICGMNGRKKKHQVQQLRKNASLSPMPILGTTEIGKPGAQNGPEQETIMRYLPFTTRWTTLMQTDQDLSQCPGH